MQLPPHGLEDRFQRLPLWPRDAALKVSVIKTWRRGEGLQVHFSDQFLEVCSGLAGWANGKTSARVNNIKDTEHNACVKSRRRTTLVNHLDPPSSYHPKCPPLSVVHSTPYGVSWTSNRGSASPAVTWVGSAWVDGWHFYQTNQPTGSSSAWRTRNGILMASRESMEDASR